MSSVNTEILQQLFLLTSVHPDGQISQGHWECKPYKCLQSWRLCGNQSARLVDAWWSTPCSIPRGTEQNLPK